MLQAKNGNYIEILCNFNYISKRQYKMSQHVTVHLNE